MQAFFFPTRIQIGLTVVFDAIEFSPATTLDPIYPRPGRVKTEERAKV